MEKIFIKPTYQEILLKDSAQDEHTDIFSYDAENDELARKLGSLFIIGHVQHSTDDLAYAISLVAALAKREYYSSNEPTPKEAFATTLKKVNEVVEEFFKEKDVALNIGIFAIANEHLLISKLGKFKIILGRDNKNIDVFNNIQFFSKEPAQETQFSSIISGKVQDSDRIFAYYPAKTVTAREKTLKADFLKLDRTQFVDKLKGIKIAKGTFVCTAVYIDLSKVTETAVAPRIQPQELSQEASLAQIQAKKGRKSIGDVSNALSKEATAAESAETNGHSKLTRLPAPDEEPEEFEEVPRIIPTEFSLNTKRTVFSKIRDSFHVTNLNPKKKAVMSLLVVALAVGGIWTARSAFFQDAEVQQADAAVQEAANSLKLARTKVTQNDITGARLLLVSSINSLAGKTESKEANEIRDQLLRALDDLDQAIDAQLSLVLEIPTEMGQASLLTAREEGVAFYSTTSDGAFVVRIDDNATIESVAEIEGMNPSRLLTGKDALLLIDSEQGSIARIRAEEAVTASLDFSQILNSALYEDNLYILLGSDIQKITDAAKTNTKPSAWLKNSALPSDPLLMTVDGNIYVLGKSGYITTYFLGEKSAEFSTSLSPKTENLFLSTPEGDLLYLVDKETGRIYLIDKKTGNINRTLKIGNGQSISDASIAPDGTLYILTNDNKIWQVK
ncbi:MAG: hypothetical protein Q8P35_02510 [Candidatus Yanofskybacteria bacterium]|nr:hypothetical protein [Candidatus Yanofskybacteria bacterium]